MVDNPNLLSLAIFFLIVLWLFAKSLYPFIRKVDERHPRILMYHMIRPKIKGAKFNKLRVSPQDFERQLAWLTYNGWNFIHMSELMGLIHNPMEKCVALTFDDGFEDNFTHAFPLLQKYQAKATLYLVTDRHNRDWSTSKKAHHDSGELEREPKLSDQQVQAMIDSGLIELGGHTLTHANLDKLSLEDKYQEIGLGKQMLEDTFNAPVKSFAYPFGIYSEEDTKLVASLGFTNAVLAEGGIETDLERRPFKVRRIKISGKDSLIQFRNKMLTGARSWFK